MNPKVAVLLCAHNAERFIAQAIESILKQTYKDYEFIIVENSSNDNTWSIIKSYSDTKIRAFQTPLKQLTFNLNYGLIQTKAEYIARMDADDIAKPERIERQVNYLDAHPDVVVLGTAFELFGTDEESRVVFMPETNKAIRRRLPFRFCFCHPTVMFRREIILEHGGYQGGSYSQDVDLWLRLSRDKALKFANLKEPLLKYRIHPNQAKGRGESYILNASQLFREALVQKSARFFLGFIISSLKIFRSQTRFK